MKRMFSIGLVGLVFVSGCDEVETVGPRGGTVTSPDGRVTLDIPAGALDDELFVHIDVVEQEGPQGTITRIYEIEPRLTQLHVPATLTYDLGTPDVEGAQSLDLSDARMDGLTLMTEKAEGWERLPDRDVDPQAELVSGSVVFFSSYAIVYDG